VEHDALSAENDFKPHLSSANGSTPSLLFDKEKNQPQAF
jgi:hypothetical protein